MSDYLGISTWWLQPIQQNILKLKEHLIQTMLNIVQIKKSPMCKACVNDSTCREGRLANELLLINLGSLRDLLQGNLVYLVLSPSNCHQLLDVS